MINTNVVVLSQLVYRVAGPDQQFVSGRVGRVGSGRIRSQITNMDSVICPTESEKHSFILSPCRNSDVMRFGTGLCNRRKVSECSERKVTMPCRDESESQLTVAAFQLDSYLFSFSDSL